MFLCFLLKVITVLLLVLMKPIILLAKNNAYYCNTQICSFLYIFSHSLLHCFIHSINSRCFLMIIFLIKRVSEKKVPNYTHRSFYRSETKKWDMSFLLSAWLLVLVFFFFCEHHQSSCEHSSRRAAASQLPAQPASCLPSPHPPARPAAPCVLCAPSACLSSAPSACLSSAQLLW